MSLLHGRAAFGAGLSAPQIPQESLSVALQTVAGQIACNDAGAIPPASLIELTLAPGGGQDFYDVSLVDGFNVPLELVPQGGSSVCSTTSCPANVNSVCTAELAVKESDGGVIACKSACLAFNRPDYCFTGTFGSPDTCPPTDYSQICF